MSRRPAPRPTPTRLAWRRFCRHRPALAGGVLLAGLALVILVGPWIGAAAGLDGESVDLFNRYQPPGPGHPLGTDELGRDLLMRLLAGGRVSLAVGLTAAVAAAIIGTALGIAAGYFGGRLDVLIMRLTDGVIALPLLPLLIVLAAIDPVKLGIGETLARSESFSLYRIVAIIALVGWTTVARLARAAALGLREQEFVRAAIAQGLGAPRVMLRHVLPNAASPILVATTLTVGNVVLFESVLSFLGLGIQPPVASWGNMLTNAQELIHAAPALAIWPGLAIFATVIGCNLLGDGLQAALDPRSQAHTR